VTSRLYDSLAETRMIICSASSTSVCRHSAR